MTKDHARAFDGGCDDIMEIIVRRLATVLLACSFAGLFSGCAKPPRLRGQVTLRLMADRDFAQILLAHCESGIELMETIRSLNVDKDIAAVTEVMRRNEEGDRAAILSWIANQSAQPTAVGRIGETDIKSTHAKVIEQLRSRDSAQLNEHVLRVLVSHRNEELAEIGKTPVEDRNLRRIVDSIRRRLAVEVKDLARRLPVQQSEVTSGGELDLASVVVSTLELVPWLIAVAAQKSIICPWLAFSWPSTTGSLVTPPMKRVAALPL